jgi:hypothetical protein
MPVPFPSSLHQYYAAFVLSSATTVSLQRVRMSFVVMPFSGDSTNWLQPERRIDPWIWLKFGLSPVSPRVVAGMTTNLVAGNRIGWRQPLAAAFLKKQRQNGGLQQSLSSVAGAMMLARGWTVSTLNFIPKIIIMTSSIELLTQTVGSTCSTRSANQSILKGVYLQVLKTSLNIDWGHGATYFRQRRFC